MPQALVADLYQSLANSRHSNMASSSPEPQDSLGATAEALVAATATLASSTVNNTNSINTTAQNGGHSSSNNDQMLNLDAPINSFDRQQELIKLIAQHFHHQFYQLNSSQAAHKQLSQQLQAHAEVLAAQQQQHVQHQPHLSASQHHQQQHQLEVVNSLNQSGSRRSSQVPPPPPQLANPAQITTANSNNNSIQQALLDYTQHAARANAATAYPTEHGQLSTRGRLGSFELTAAQQAADRLPGQGHLIRSQLSPSLLAASELAAINADHSIGLGQAASSTQPDPCEMARIRCGQNYINDIGLLNMLGLNLTNNQLVLSLQQQQSLIGAASAAAAAAAAATSTPANRHNLIRDRLESQHEFNRLTQQQRYHEQAFINRQEQHLQSNVPYSNHNSVLDKTRQLACNKPAISKNNQAKYRSRTNNDKSRSSGHNEMLKFGINTILGNHSSHEDADSPAPSHTPPTPETIQTNYQHGADKTIYNRQIPSDQLHADESAGSVSSDCESNPAATTPVPQSCNGPNMFSHIDQRHQSANNNLLAINVSSQNAVNYRTTNLNNNNISGNNLSTQAAILHHHVTHSKSSIPFHLANAAPAFPWTVAARGKPRRGMMRRAVFSDSQRVGLEKRFQLQKYISKPDRKKLAEKLGLRDSQVKIWFQNRRMKWRNSKERELLSAGGSREQTLPTRNNPNPDLSDVGETVRRITSTPTINIKSVDSNGIKSDTTRSDEGHLKICQAQ